MCKKGILQDAWEEYVPMAAGDGDLYLDGGLVWGYLILSCGKAIN